MKKFCLIVSVIFVPLVAACDDKKEAAPPVEVVVVDAECPRADGQPCK